MAEQVRLGAMMQCNFGMASQSLVVLPTKEVFTNQAPDADSFLNDLSSRP